MTNDNNRTTESDDGRIDGMRRRILGATAGGISLAALNGVGTVGASEDEGETVTLIYDTHFEGRFGDEDEANIARYQTKVEELRNQYENTLFVGGGDDLSPSVEGALFEGEHIIEALNEMELDVNGISHHDFDFGADVAEQRFEESDFPWVNAQLHIDGDPIPEAERWTTIDAGGLTVGFFSAAREDFYSVTDYPEEYDLLSKVEGAEAAVEALTDEGADIIIGAGRVPRGEKFNLPEQVDGIDALLGSSGDVDPGDEDPTMVDGTIVSRVGKEFDHLGALTVDANGDFVEWERVDIGSDVEPDPDVQAVVDRWMDELDDELGGEAFTVDRLLDTDMGVNYGRESFMGNLICDAFLDKMGGDVAIQNSGGIRSGEQYGPGSITGRDIMDILPFPNTLVKIELTGETLIEWLGRQAQPGFPETNFGAEPAKQVGGVQYEYNSHEVTNDEDDWDLYYRPEISNVYVQGEPIQEDEYYEVVTTDHLLGARDVLEGANVVDQTTDLLGEIVLEYLEEKGTVEPRQGNRILRVDAEIGHPTDFEVDGQQVTFTFERPDPALSIYPDSFYAVTEHHDDIRAETVTATEDEIEVVFSSPILTAMRTGPSDANIRVFGGFEPDDEYYGYEDEDGTLRELPVSGEWEYFVLKGTIDTPWNRY
ncbi:bifunctional metallophosphatase/5'-nucleotidase [Natronorubrum sp. JWXQ-INN-674]|uniref:Bifunctional metallophosphatase/5'-nucleotidase n=1 Tax=Natronorubrum halalkaliphilum TaxID=2691917 RepID=A0A6B0VGC7_9EURY|nr:5'-nucleotidase C-terminal domain-containing protein [Natronorubrum halalkaliphilum]MXV60544.1 bifunctional metallophosphatase/5'-nucleotidase [Natronorubrum halalkaliphilum]